ncbi:MAG: mercuric reductase [Leptolyngbyaceae cyanobacterium CAN_BIN12]|nr:mercuric reductase [Leptolyngbyaceae cyanobacterium CAN_BIN12]
MSLQLTKSLISPLDEYNQALISQVHPLDWVNPTPAERYDLVVIGAGTAGLVVAAGAAGLGIGLKVALIEKHLMGGDCLNVGCVPSKCMIRSSRVVAEIRDSDRFGVKVNGAIEVDFPAVMRRMRQIRAEISPNDSADRMQKLGVDVFLGQGHFHSSDTIQVDDAILRFKKAVLATGARASHPTIPGLAEAGFLTNETVFNLTDRPARLAVIGGGPIGCELAQTFQRLGSEVVLFHKNSHLLDREDSDAAEIIQQVFIQEGIQLQLDSQLERVEKTNDGKVLYFIRNGQPEHITVDEILIGAGRSPNVEGLNLEQVGVNYDPHQGVMVNDYLQTSNSNIYAAGDICMDWKFTHAADAAARIVIKNTLFSPFGIGRSKLSDLVMPWSTYTSPEIAHVGLYEQEAIAKGLEVDVIHIPLNTVDRAIADGETNGFVKILHKRGSDEIVGATIVAAHAGDLISAITLAITAKIGLSKLSTVIHPYPTQAEAIKKAADAYRRTLLTPKSKNLLGILARLG